MRYDYWSASRESAEVLPNNLRLLREDVRGKFAATLWLPKAKKPVWNICFNSASAREAKIEESIRNFDQAMAHRSERKAAEKAAQDNGDLSLVDPGTIFCYSWGYDQTNVEYFQVVARSGKLVTLRPIGSETVPGTQGDMSSHVRPVKDKFIARCEECRLSIHAAVHNENCGDSSHVFVPSYADIKKRVGFDHDGSPSFSMDHGWLRPVKVISFGNMPAIVVGSHYRSSYA